MSEVKLGHLESTTDGNDADDEMTFKRKRSSPKGPSDTCSEKPEVTESVLATSPAKKPKRNGASTDKNRNTMMTEDGEVVEGRESTKSLKIRLRMDASDASNELAVADQFEDGDVVDQRRSAALRKLDRRTMHSQAFSGRSDTKHTDTSIDAWSQNLNALRDRLNGPDASKKLAAVAQSKRSNKPIGYEPLTLRLSMNSTRAVKQTNENSSDSKVDPASPFANPEPAILPLHRDAPQLIVIAPSARDRNDEIMRRRDQPPQTWGKDKTGLLMPPPRQDTRKQRQGEKRRVRERSQSIVRSRSNSRSGSGTRSSAK